MAIAFDAASADVQSGTGTSLTYAHTCTGSNGLLVVGVMIFNGTDVVTGVTYNSVAMTRANAEQFGDAGQYQYLYYLLGPSTGSNNVVISLSSSVSLQSGATSYTGVKQSGQPDSNSVNFSTTNAVSYSQSNTTVADNCWMIWSIGNNGGFGFSSTVTNGALRVGHTFAGAGGQFGIMDTNGVQTPAGSKSMTCSSGNGSGQKYGGVMVAFSPAAASVNSNFLAFM